MEFDIFSIGDSEFLEQVLIALAMLTNVADFTQMVAVGLLIGVFGTILSAISKGGREFDIHHVFLGYIIYATMFVPTASVNIEDTYTGDVRRVDNVPIGPAAAGGIISLIGFKITELFEVAYNPVIPRVTQSEFAESLKLLNSVRIKSTDSSIWKGLNADAGGQAVDLRRSWFNYIKDCTLKKIDLSLMSEDDLVNAQYIQALQFNSMLFGTQIWIAPGEIDGREVTCQEGWEELNNATNIGDETTRAFDAVLAMSSASFVGANSRDKTNDAIQALLASATDAQTYMKIAVLEPILLEAADRKMNQLQDISGSMMINQAIQQRNTTWSAEQTLFMTIVRPMLAFFEAFTYSVAPIMAFIIVLGAKGIQLAGKYFTTLLWIQLWMPILSIVNLYIYTSATRSLASFNALDGHNWDSFYALQTTSDVTQHWLATGGLLAASTPAIALMLVYGSSVTATHLAGRLKNDKFIDENMQTPSLHNSAPLATLSSNYSGDSISGMVKTGAKDMFASANVNNALSHQQQSLDTTQNTQSEDFKSGLANSLESSSTASSLFQKASAVGQLAKSSDSDIASNSYDRARQFAKEHHLNDAHTTSLAGAAAMQATLGASMDVNKMASALAGPMGVSQDALKRFLADSSKKDDSGGPIDIKGSAAVTGSVNNTTTDQSQEQYSRKGGHTQGMRYTQADQASFVKDLSSALTRQNSDTFQRSWGDKDAKTLQNMATELNATSQAFTEVSGLSSSIGSSSNLNLRTVGALAAGRAENGLSGNTDAQDLLNKSWQMQPEAVKNDANSLFERYKQWGMPSDVADNTAKLTALTNTNNYKGNPSTLVNGSMLAASVIRKATGIGGESSDYSYGKYDGTLDTPKPIKGDIKQEASGLASPEMSGFGLTRANATAPLGNGLTEQNPYEGFLRANHGSQAEQVRQGASDKENQVINGTEQAARTNLINSYDTSKAAALMGGFDNAANWTGRRAEELAGSTEAYLSESLGSMKKGYESLKSMSTEDVSKLRTAVANDDDRLFDSLGVAGTVFKGAENIKNSAIGAAITGIDTYNNGQDFSDAAKGMSLVERGAMYSAVISHALTVDGPQGVEKFMENHGAEFKSTMEAIGRDKYNLTPQQAAVFAESYDTDSKAMGEKVSALQSQYAIKDNNGNPTWDSNNNEWAMTPENRELAQAILNRIDLATGAGDQVGAYLAPLSGYNVATQKIVPPSEGDSSPPPPPNPSGTEPFRSTHHNHSAPIPPPIPNSSTYELLEKPI